MEDVEELADFGRGNGEGKAGDRGEALVGLRGEGEEGVVHVVRVEGALGGEGVGEVARRDGPALEHLEEPDRRAEAVEVVDFKVEDEFFWLLGFVPVLGGWPEPERVPWGLGDARLFLLSAENVEQNGAAERVAHDMHLSLKLGVALHEDVVNPVRFFQHNLDDLFPVGALVEEDVQSEIGDERPGERDSFDRDVVEGGVLCMSAAAE